MKTLFLLLSCALAFGQVKLPPYQRQSLPNGALLSVIEKRDVPMAAIRVTVRGGIEAEPAPLAGLASVTTELLRRGTSSREPDGFAEELDYLGARMTTSVGEQASEVEMQFLSKDLDRAADLLVDALLRPAFPAKEVDKVIAQHIDEARAIKDNPQQANLLYFRPFFFGASHPYGRPPGGDERSLGKIRREDIAAFHKRMFVGRNMIVTAAGDLAPAEVRPKLARLFGAIPAGEAYSWASGVVLPQRPKPRLLLVDKPDSTQTYFVIAQPGIRRTDPGRVTLHLVNTLFGGRFTSMLNDELRVNSGLTYGAFSSVQEDRLTGAIRIVTYTKTESTVEAIDLALDVLARLRRDGITAAQLASAKAYMKGTYPPRALETFDQIAATAAGIELFGLNRGEVDDLFSRIDAVTLEQANTAVRKYYVAENLQFCLLGNAAKIREQVARYAPARKEVPLSEPGFAAPEF